MIRVVALELGFYAGARRRVGDEFDMDPKDCKLATDGVTRLLPKWVAPASELAHAVIAKRKAVSEQKFVDAAIVSSGSAGAARRRRGFQDAMRTGPSRDAGAEAAALVSSGNATAGAKREEFDRHRPATLPVISE